MNRCAIYARYSDDRQNPRSVADQVELASRHAGARGWEIVHVFSDAAISGDLIVTRPGLQAALAAGDRGEFDVLLTEDEDRIARSLEHLAHVVNRLAYAGARLATLTTERVETMHVAVKGFAAEDYRRNLSAKTKRGMHSNAEKGLATGARTYGYRSRPGGQVAIVEEEAEVIREICARYSAGESPRGIAADLNARAVAAPSGGHWNASTINGSRQRGNGVLHNELYAGVKTWGRDQVRKDYRTGRRIHAYLPPEQWKRVAVPDLRIVPEDVWAAVRIRKAAEEHQRPHELRRRRGWAFSGLVKCGCCGASMTSYDGRRRLICAAHREKGPSVCANSRTVSRAEVEARVLTALRTRLLAPAAVRAYVKAYRVAWAAKATAAAADVAPLEKRLAELSRSIGRLVDRICEGTDTPETNARLRAQEAEKAKIAARLEAARQAAPPPVALHPGLAERYAERIAELQELLQRAALSEEPHLEALIAKARDLVVRITLTPSGPGRDAPVDIRLDGTLAAFLDPPEGTEERPGLYKVVAGGGYSQRHTMRVAVAAIAC